MLHLAHTFCEDCAKEENVGGISADTDGGGRKGAAAPNLLASDWDGGVKG